MQMRDIKELKDKHKGERCFIIGTGPSLLQTNFDLIKDEILFGVNALFKGLKEFNIKPQYYAYTDNRKWNEWHKDILSLDTDLFLSGGALLTYLHNYEVCKKIQKREPYLIRMLGFMYHPMTPFFSTDLEEGTYNGDTVIIDIPLQACYYMGFEEVYLLGCDCDYSGKPHFYDEPNEPITSLAGQGDWSRVFSCYEICKDAYEVAGRKIINCTPNSKLPVFEKKKLEEVLL